MAKKDAWDQYKGGSMSLKDYWDKRDAERAKAAKQQAKKGGK
jgi:hypothetical protein